MLRTTLITLRQAFIKFRNASSKCNKDSRYNKNTSCTLKPV